MKNVIGYFGLLIFIVGFLVGLPALLLAMVGVRMIEKSDSAERAADKFMDFVERFR